ncbi:integrase arm-type DNA-binding domain-containing protein [Pseudomonas sp. R3-18-08]|uniref:tyrosine-type recombinase/integrase n=1 Tax=Pseudomonas sp. R3-18-08 TaxID=1173283 RepID=UPI000F5792A3|nr:integrase arm-type DNA-binding domain-containing protein [Pseudomonas sp. R3-18-08]AZF16289.1 Integrase [Pseudomonas sp. R3-18-08]
MSRTTTPLSDAACRTAKPRNRAYKLFDGDGLYLLVQTNGRKGWRMRYVKPNGKEGLTSFGNYPVVTLTDARAMRLEAKRLLVHGIDPIESKHKAKAEADSKGRTFESVALDWHKEMSAKWTQSHSQAVLRRLKAYVFPLIGAHPIAGLDTYDLLQPLEAIKKTGSMDVALRVKNHLLNIMREAKRARLISVNPAYDLEGSVKPPRVTHRPALPLSRLPELLERIERYAGRTLTRLTVMLSLHLFVRSSELRFARWSEFDLKRAIWEIPDTRPALEGVSFSTRGTKMAGDVHLVPLSQQAIALLKQIQSLTGGFELVFAGDANPRKPMSENTINKALRAMGYDTKSEICGHGFRTMACSALIESGLWSETAIERQMSHRERNNVRAAYIHKAEFIEERGLIMNWWSQYLEANHDEYFTPHEFAKRNRS